MYEIVIGRTESDRKKLGLKGTCFLGKMYVKMGPYVSLSNKVLLDVARSHVILVCGKRGSGKCLTGDTLIQLANGKIVPIKEIEKENSKIVALNKKLKVEKTKKEGFFKRKVNKILKVKLRSGKEIKLTLDHPLLTIKGWVPAKSLKKGDRIATPRRINAFGNKDLSEWEVKLLAYLIAEGHTKKVVLFSNSDKKIVNEFKSCIKKLNPKLKVVEDKKGHLRVIEDGFRNVIIKTNLKRDEKGRFIKGTKIEFKKRSIREFIENYNLFNKLATEKEIPQEVLQLKKKKLALFLNRLFSCDGSVYKRITANSALWQISYSSSSEKLIRQVQNLLLRFGIISKLRKKRIQRNKKEHINYKLIISPQFIEQFSKEIGFFGCKAKKLGRALKETKNKKRNPNVDTIPKEIWNIYRPKSWSLLGKKFDYKMPKGFRSKINYSPSRETLLKIAKIENNEFLKSLATSDIFWDEVEEIATIKGKFEVYDFSVPNHHNFIANDIIVHNSYTLGVIAEGISNLPEEIAQNISVLIFDTMGIYWTMKYPNEKDRMLLEQWGLKPTASKRLKIYVPAGYYKKFKEANFPADFPFSVKTAEVSPSDWCSIFDIKLTDPLGVLIEKAISSLQEKYGTEYDIDDILEFIRKDPKSTKQEKDALENRFAAAKSWGVFSKKATPLKEIVDRGKVTVLDISIYKSWMLKTLITGLVCRKLFLERMAARKLEELRDVEKGYTVLFAEETKKKIEMPLVWILVDEAHEFLPREGTTPATDALVTLLREGRQPGVSLILATQQPGEIHRDVITQSDIVVSHRITARRDIEALNNIMQTYLAADVMRYLNDLPREKGAAIILDDNSERIYPIRVRPRFSWHGGEAPTAVPVKRVELVELGL